MRTRTNPVGGIQVLACEGAVLLGGGADELPEVFDRALAGAARGIVLDLTRLDYLDSSGVGAVVACGKAAAAAGIVMKIAIAPSGPVRKIFWATQLERGFEIFDDVDSAVASFA